jgi:DNA repair exonuclease SbcCD nuclease subunit
MAKKTQKTLAPLAMIASDLHLCEHTWRSRKEIAGDALFSLRQIALLGNTIPAHLILAGDVFDTKSPSARMVYDTHWCLDCYFGESSASLYFIDGNHDKRHDISWLSLGGSLTVKFPLADHDDHEVEPVKILNPSSVEEAGFERYAELPWEKRSSYKLYGIDFMPSKELLQEQLDSLPTQGSGNILVLHQAAQGLQPHAELTDGMLPDDVDFCIVGHTHQAKFFTLLSKSGKRIPCLSPGATRFCAVSEEIPNYVWLLCTDGSLWRRPLKQRGRLEVDLCDQDVPGVLRAIDAVLSYEPDPSLPEELRTPILVAGYNSGTTLNWREILEDKLGKTMHVFAVNKDTEEEEDDAAEEEIRSRFDAASREYAMELFAEKEKDERVRAVTLKLLDSDMSEDAYKQVKEFFLKGKV